DPTAPLFASLSLSIDTANTDIYTLSLHDALPIFTALAAAAVVAGGPRLHHRRRPLFDRVDADGHVAQHVLAEAHLALHLLDGVRSEEHTSELQSRENLVCRLLLEKKKDFRSAEIM